MLLSQSIPFFFEVSLVLLSQSIQFLLDILLLFPLSMLGSCVIHSKIIGTSVRSIVVYSSEFFLVFVNNCDSSLTISRIIGSPGVSLAKCAEFAKSVSLIESLSRPALSTIKYKNSLHDLFRRYNY